MLVMLKGVVWQSVTLGRDRAHFNDRVIGALVRGGKCSGNLAALRRGESKGAGCADVANGRFAIEGFRRPFGSTRGRAHWRVSKRERQ